MLEIKADFRRKETEINTKDCVVDKVIKLSGAEFDRFSRNLMREWDFIRDNPIDTVVDKEGRYHCLLVTGEGRRDGILVNSEGANYARCSAFIPSAEDLLTVGQSPALAALNKKLTDIVDHFAEPTGQKYVVDLHGIDADFGIDLMTNGALQNTVLDMLGEKPGVNDWELDKNELIIYYDMNSFEKAADDLSDPTVTPTDMYAYGYSWDGMIPLGRERALELFDAGCAVYRLYEDSAEGEISTREEIDTFDGLFGIEDPAWVQPEQEPPFQVFILNRERYDKDEPAGEWLTLPTDADTLRGLFERIGIDRPSEGAFTVTAIRMPLEDYLKDHVTKYDSIDELNMLASYMGDMRDYELEKLKAILTSGVTDFGKGTAALINLLDEGNFTAVDLIDAKNAFELGQYYILDVPYKMSLSDYGEKVAKEEKGVFTEAGYLYNKYDLEPEYTGDIPDEYKIVGAALQGLHPKTPARERLDEKLSVIEQIMASRHAAKETRDVPATKKNKGEPDL